MFGTQTITVGNHSFEVKRPSFGQRLEMIRLVERVQGGSGSAALIEQMIAQVDRLMIQPETDSIPHWTELLDWDQGIDLLMQVAAISKATEDERKNSESPR